MMKEKPTWFYTNAPTLKAALKLMKSRHKVKLALRLSDIEEFINRMKDRGYTNKQIKLLTDWYLRVRKSN